jgi:hypothetical protein
VHEINPALFVGAIRDFIITFFFFFFLTHFVKYHGSTEKLIDRPEACLVTPLHVRLQ